MTRRGVRRTGCWARRIALSAVAWAFLLGGAGDAAAQRPEWEAQLPEGAGTHPKGSLFIQDLDTIWTAAGTILTRASILIVDGVIEEIGVGIQAPDGVPVLDGRGFTAIPGIVDEHSHTAMIAGSNEGSASVVAEVRVLDALDAEALAIYRALSGGVTTARIMHGSANPIGGQSAVIKMRWGMERSEQLLLPGAPRFVKFALGENVTRKSRTPLPGQPVRFPSSRPGVEAVFVEAFTAAREYEREWEGYRENPERYRVPPRKDLRLEALLSILRGRIRIHAHSYRSDEILMLMRVGERFGVKIDVFTHALEGYKVASEMAAHGAAGSTFSDWWQYKLEAYDGIPYNAAIMHQQGVLTAINSDISSYQPFMIYQIAKPVRYGRVSKEDALRMVTLNPAVMMHIDDKVGSLEPGKHGDVVLLNTSPFDSFVRVEKTVVDGILYFDLSREAETRNEPFRARPAPEPRVDATASAGTSRSSAGGSAPASEAGPRGGALSRTEAGDLSAGGDADRGSPPAGPGNGRRARGIAFVGATIHPVSGPAIPNGALLVEGETIAAVGAAAEVRIPDGYERIDVSGKHLYPGMIDPISDLGLYEFGGPRQATDVSEIGRFNPHVRAIVGVHPHGAGIKVARMNGVTSALVAQSGGVIAGTAGMIQLAGDTWERSAIKAEAALRVNFPAPSRRPGGREGAVTVPSLEGGTMEELVELFRRARLYDAERSVRREADAPFLPNVRAGDEVVLEALLPAIRGEMPVLFMADTEWEIRTLFVFLDEFSSLNPVLVGATEGYRVAEELAKRKIPVIVTSSNAISNDRNESIAINFRNPALLHAAGVKVALGIPRSSGVRNLPYDAAHAGAYGLPREAALRSVTLHAAEALGLGDLLGSLDAGKRADLLVTDGDPLQILTTIERMFIGGREVDPRDNKHDRLYEAFRKRM